MIVFPKHLENVVVGDVRQELLQYINPVFQHKLKPAEKCVPQSFVNRIPEETRFRVQGRSDS